MPSIPTRFAAVLGITLAAGAFAVLPAAPAGAAPAGPPGSVRSGAPAEERGPDVDDYLGLVLDGAS
ncbi:hypothetical protein JL107_18770 [Nakamurella flavida]|uniref:Uncharacterized protein n=1 Tax=Nakamurella flavida TaxID=363630 RepID=A0A939C6U1_9ACTN|nr:hypothetical protein [Nakamurella flavida]MBM9478499.1 hypothetical protein [Nakamurella flavida]MDP9777675.1 hypothetical protein [Nakamurella flavida]